MRYSLRTLQFDLKYALGETLLFGLCMGFFRIAYRYPHDEAFTAAPFVFFGIVTGCAAVGGLFLRPIAGAVVGLAFAGLVTPLWAVVCRGIGV